MVQNRKDYGHQSPTVELMMDNPFKAYLVDLTISEIRLLRAYHKDDIENQMRKYSNHPFHLIKFRKPVHHLVLDISNLSDAVMNELSNRLEGCIDGHSEDKFWKFHRKWKDAYQSRDVETIYELEKDPTAYTMSKTILQIIASNPVEEIRSSLLKGEIPTIKIKEPDPVTETVDSIAEEVRQRDMARADKAAARRKANAEKARQKRIDKESSANAYNLFLKENS